MKGNSVYIHRDNVNAQSVGDEFIARVHREGIYAEIHNILKA